LCRAHAVSGLTRKRRVGLARQPAFAEPEVVALLTIRVLGAAVGIAFAMNCGPLSEITRGASSRCSGDGLVTTTTSGRIYLGNSAGIVRIREP
jgi:hypothetical protein